MPPRVSSHALFWLHRIKKDIAGLEAGNPNDPRDGTPSREGTAAPGFGAFSLRTRMSEGKEGERDVTCKPRIEKVDWEN